MARGTLILVSGPSGAGKTTLARRLENERGAIRLSPDDWIEAILSSPDDLRERDRLRDPVENLQWDLARKWLAIGLTVILENGFWSEEERTLYAVEAVELGVLVELHVVVPATFQALWERVHQRNESLTSPLWAMSEEEARHAYDLFESPTAGELAFYDEAIVY